MPHQSLKIGLVRYPDPSKIAVMRLAVGVGQDGGHGDLEDARQVVARPDLREAARLAQLAQERAEMILGAAVVAAPERELEEEDGARAAQLARPRGLRGLGPRLYLRQREPPRRRR